MSNSRPKRKTKRSTKLDDFVSDSVAGKNNKNSSNKGEASNGGNVSDNGEFKEMMGCENNGKGDKKCCSKHDMNSGSKDTVVTKVFEAEKELMVSNDKTQNGMSAEGTNSDVIDTPSDSPGSLIDVADKVTGCKSPNASSSMLNNIDSTNSGNINAESPNSSKTATYADKLNNNMDASASKLFQIPTVLNEDGHEYVIFDDEIIDEESGPWIVNNKPMVVQKWSTSINMDKTEPATLPLWIKLTNHPLEAWSSKGLSALASRIGKPLIMDTMTTKMCTQGVGRLGYARVLVEEDANKGLNDSIDYKSKVDGHQLRTEEKTKDKQTDEDGFVQANKRKDNHDTGNRKVPQQTKVNIPKEKPKGPPNVMYKQKVRQDVGPSKPTENVNVNTQKAQNSSPRKA
ncbi:hypothetical protein CTI12_AA342550 [Artemisia annua]|uniref:Uncharacterized protein n=1 Tax=Artemisia annua TaxID=35608 RepID=A0A2U1MT63_ARTAN|nr:hypothetical protein CTI12_AA342550 [Artemisia annua]